MPETNRQTRFGLKKTCNATDLLHHKTELLGFGYSILAYGGCARSTRGSRNLAVLPKRHNNSLFPKIKTMFKSKGPQNSNIVR